MKKSVLSLLMVLLFVSTACAETKEFQLFTMDVPSGWEAQDGGMAVGLAHQDSGSGLSVVISPSHGQTAEFFANATAEQFKAKVKTEGDAYVVDFDVQGQKGTMYFTAQKDQIVIVTLAGTNKDLVNMAKSIKVK